MPIIASHLVTIKPSAVSVMSAKALELERQGKDIIRLSAGEPDFPTPDHIKMACIKALCENRTNYPPVIGLPELREALLRADAIVGLSKAASDACLRLGESFCSWEGAGGTAESGSARLLLVVQDYPSFNSAEDLYFDLRFAVPLADRIERLAVVGDRVWKDTWISLFGLFSGIRTAYFDRSEMDRAWQWVSAA